MSTLRMLFELIEGGGGSSAAPGAFANRSSWFLKNPATTALVSECYPGLIDKGATFAETVLVVAVTIVLSSLVIETAFRVYQWMNETAIYQDYRLEETSAPDFDQGRYFRDGRWRGGDSK